MKDIVKEMDLIGKAKDWIDDKIANPHCDKKFFREYAI
jgi:hypothetical protein